MHVFGLANPLVRFQHRKSHLPIGYHTCSATVLIYTRRQSVMTLVMEPWPANSTTFSCQLSRTLIAPETGSLDVPGREPT